MKNKINKGKKKIKKENKKSLKLLFLKTDFECRCEWK